MQQHIAAAYAQMHEQVGYAAARAWQTHTRVSGLLQIGVEIIFNVSDKSYNPFPCQDA